MQGQLTASALGQARALAGPVNVCAAVELSKSRWVLAIQVPTSEKISVHKVAGGDVRSLLQLLDRTRSKLVAAGFDQVEVHSCYEIGYDGFWLHRLLEREGIHNHVLDSASIYVSRRGRHVKTDRLDAEALVRVLLALLRGERRVCSVVQVPTPREEDEKRPAPLARRPGSRPDPSSRPDQRRACPPGRPSRQPGPQRLDIAPKEPTDP